MIEKLFEEFLGTLESRILPGNPVQRLRNIRVEPATAWVLMEYLCYSFIFCLNVNIGSIDCTEGLWNFTNTITFN